MIFSFKKILLYISVYVFQWWGQANDSIVLEANSEVGEAVFSI